MTDDEYSLIEDRMGVFKDSHLVPREADSSKPTMETSETNWITTEAASGAD